MTEPWEHWSAWPGVMRPSRQPGRMTFRIRPWRYPAAQVELALLGPRHGVRGALLLDRAEITTATRLLEHLQPLTMPARHRTSLCTRHDQGLILLQRRGPRDGLHGTISAHPRDLPGLRHLLAAAGGELDARWPAGADDDQHPGPRR